jgi:hypothetical protein
LLGDAWLTVPDAIRRAHQPTLRAHGLLTIQHGPSVAARAVAWLLRLPAAGANVKTTLSVISHDVGEEWLRDFGGRTLRTEQYALPTDTLGERFGILEFQFALSADRDALTYRQRATRLALRTWRWSLPAIVAPCIAARERAIGGRSLDLSVHVTLPLVGELLSYAGVVHIDEGGA